MISLTAVAFFGSLGAGLAGQTIDQKPVCLVTPDSLKAEALEQWSGRGSEESQGFKDTWTVVEDDLALYAFYAKDPAIRYYREVKDVHTLLYAAMERGTALKLSALPEGLRAEVRNALRRLGPISANDEKVELGFSVSEVYTLTNNGKTVQASLRSDVVQSDRIRADGIEDPSPPIEGAPPAELTEMSAGDLTVSYLGPSIAHRTNAILAGRAMTAYSEFVRSLEEDSARAAKSWFERAIREGRYGLEPLAFKPTSGEQIDGKRRNLLLVSGVPVGADDGIDAFWIRGCTITDQYYLASFSVRYAEEPGRTPRTSIYSLPVRFRN